MQKIILSTLFLLGVLTLYGQIQKDVLAILTKKDFQALQVFEEKNRLELKTKGIEETDVLRVSDIVSDYRKGVYDFSGYDMYGVNINGIHFYKANCIIKGNRIVYYDLAEKRFEQNKAPHYETITRYTDDSLLRILNTVYTQAFSSPVVLAELFDEDMLYGFRCGEAATIIAERAQIAKWVQQNDDDQLRTWLQSANIVKQVYAVDGYYQLKKKGILPSTQDIAMIRLVLNKTGYIRTCTGCFMNHEQLKEVLKDFNF